MELKTSNAGDTRVDYAEEEAAMAAVVGAPVRDSNMGGGLRALYADLEGGYSIFAKNEVDYGLWYADYDGQLMDPWRVVVDDSDGVPVIIVDGFDATTDSLVDAVQAAMDRLARRDWTEQR